MDDLDFFVNKRENLQPVFTFAIIGDVYNDGVTLIFPGQTVASNKRYKCNNSIPFQAGDRVKVLHDSGTYVVEYVVGDPGSGSGSGDMLASVYDPAGGEKQVVFTDDSRLSDARIPSAHTHTVSDVTDFPSTMPPSAHKHAAGDITSGTLDSARLPTVPLTKGGTGQTTAAKGLYALINGATAITAASVADTDYIGLDDVSATTGKKMLISELKTLVGGGGGGGGGGAQIAFGTYNGTGTNGRANPTSLIFNFEPKLLWVTKSGFIESTHRSSSTTADYLNLQMFLINGVTSASLNNGTTATGTVTISWSGNTVSWHSSNADLQLNSGGRSYYYLAIG